MGYVVSVIVPVYNAAPYLKRCIESITAQTYKNFELILVDDGSTDESGIICDRYAKADNRIRVIHQENAGVCAARNKGIEGLTGDFFLFLDSDDSLEPEALEVCIDRIILDASDVVVFGRREIRNGEEINSGVYDNGVLRNNCRAVHDILKDRHMYGGGYPNKMWRTASFQNRVGGIPQYNETLFYVEDMEWVIRMFLNADRISVIDQIFYNYYLRDNSVSYSQDLNEKRLIGYHDTMAQIVYDLREYPELCTWFDGIRYTELVNSVIDAKLKGQKAVYRTLIKKLQNKEKVILLHRKVKMKIKLRLIFIETLHFLGKI